MDANSFTDSFPEIWVQISTFPSARKQILSPLVRGRRSVKPNPAKSFHGHFKKECARSYGNQLTHSAGLLQYIVIVICGDPRALRSFSVVVFVCNCSVFPSEISDVFFLRQCDFLVCLVCQLKRLWVFEIVNCAVFFQG